MIWLIPIFFVVLVIWRNWWMYQNFCMPTFDIGIFIDFANKIQSGQFNPYSDVRQIHQYVDHFTPALQLAGWLGAVIPQPYTLFAIELFSLLSVFLVLIWSHRRGWISGAACVYAVALVGLNRDMFETAFFPIHPAVWAMPYLVLIALLSQKDMVSDTRSLKRSSYWMILALAVLAAATDEQFSFSVLGFGIGMLIVDRFSPRSLFAFGLGGFAVWLAHSGRRLFAGELMPYYEQRLPVSWESWVQKYSWTLDSFKTGFQHLLVLVPLIFVIRRPLVKYFLRYWKHVMLMGGVFGPLILGRILTANFGFHYNTVMIAFYVAVVVFLLDPERAKSLRIRKAGFVPILIVFMLVLSVGKWKRPLTAQAFGDGLNCKRSEVAMSDFRQRRSQLRGLLEDLAQQAQSGENWIVLSNLTPNWLSERPDLNVFCLCGFEIRNADKMDGLVTERGRFGEFVGFREELNEQIIEKVRGLPGIEILRDTPDLFAVKGKIPVELINPLLSPHPVYR